MSHERTFSYCGSFFLFCETDSLAEVHMIMKKELHSEIRSKFAKTSVGMTNDSTKNVPKLFKKWFMENNVKTLE